MLTRTIVAIASFVAISASSLATQVAPSVREQFLATWSRRAVVLKKPMYSIAYDGSRGQAITVVSPDKGSYFQIEIITDTGRGFRISPPILDRDPEQLLSKVAVELGSRSAPRLLTYKTKSMFKATARFLEQARDGRSRLAFDLFDDLDEKNQATLLWVHWPTEFSPEFTERSAVEKLIAEFFGT